MVPGGLHAREEGSSRILGDLRADEDRERRAPIEAARIRPEDEAAAAAHGEGRGLVSARRRNIDLARCSRSAPAPSPGTSRKAGAEDPAARAVRPGPLLEGRRVRGKSRLGLLDARGEACDLRSKLREPGAVRRRGDEQGRLDVIAVRRLDGQVLAVPEDGGELVEVALGHRVELVVVALAHWIVRPSQPSPRASIRSLATSAATSSAITPPSAVLTLERR